MRRMTVAERFGANLRGVRKARGMTQEELAWRCRLHPTQLSRIECGKNLPGGETIAKLIAALQTTLFDLYEGIDWDPERGVFVVAPP